MLNEGCYVLIKSVLNKKQTLRKHHLGRNISLDVWASSTMFSSSAEISRRKWCERLDRGEVVC